MNSSLGNETWRHEIRERERERERERVQSLHLGGNWPPSIAIRTVEMLMRWLTVESLNQVDIDL